MPTQADVSGLRRGVSLIVAAAIGDLSQVWRLLFTGQGSRKDLVEAFPDVVAPFIASVSDLTASWYDELLPGSRFLAQPAELPPVEQLASSAEWATRNIGSDVTDVADPLSLLSGSASRYVTTASRQTVLDNAESEGARWVRHASANACAFCRLLSTRGAVYWSQEKAAAGHDDCHCLLVPVRPGDDYEPASYVSGWEREYAAARRGTDGSLKAVLANMRRND